MQKRLGQGAMGEVWLATHLLLDEPRAIKLVLSDVSNDPLYRQLFIQSEARYALRLDRHPNIVRMYELSQFQDVPYIVMEFVQSNPAAADLKELIVKKGKFTPDEAAPILYQIAAALEVAHKQGLVHRDVKPANVLIDAQGQMKLNDFGLIKDFSAQNATGLSVDRITGSPVMPTFDKYSGGTPSYMAPEQAARQAEPRSDLYSLGVILYQMLAGRLPFTGHASELKELHARVPPPPLQDFVPGLSEAVSVVVLRALAKRPQDRWGSVREFATAYSQALEGKPVTGQEEGLQGVGSSAKASQKADKDNTALSIPPCPYKGLFAFEEVDAPFFFGREAVVNQLVKAVQQRSLVAVVGASGSGKSSVVYAGLIPKLRASQQALPIGGSSANWQIASFRPGDRPFQNLAEALLTLLEGQAGPNESEHIQKARGLAGALFAGEIHLSDLVQQVQQRYGKDARLLLVANQFEELFTLCRDEQERVRFLAELLSLSNAETVTQPKVCVVLTLRADFMGHALSYRVLADALQQGQYNLGPMNRAELVAAIEGPARKQGVILEEGLTGRILDAVSERPGDLPLLEFAMTLLWGRQIQRRLTLKTYQEMGGVEMALAGYAEQVYSRLPAPGRLLMQQVMVQLVRPGEGTADTRRIATRAEIGEANWPLVIHLADQRLVVSNLDPLTMQETVEIVHEALIGRWQRLRDWMAVSRQFRSWQERLRAVMQQWEATNRDEGALLRGAALGEAVEWLQPETAKAGAISQQLASAEQEFIQLS